MIVDDSIVDDSAAMRQLLTEILSSDPDIEVVGSASDPSFVRDKIKQLQPDVLTLDIEMPRMDGLTFLEKLMHGHPMPVVMVSSLTQRGADLTFRALELGAVDFFPKPTLGALDGVDGSAAEIAAKVKNAARVNRRRLPPAVEPSGSRQERSAAGDGAVWGQRPGRTKAAGGGGCHSVCPGQAGQTAPSS